MKIGKEIALEIERLNIYLCPEFTSQMITFSNYTQLANMYFKGSDWSMENDFPRLDILRKHKLGLIPCGLLTDVSSEYSNVRYLGVFGNSNVVLNYDKFSVAQCIIRHNSKAKIYIKDYSKIQINILDNADVEVICSEEGSASVFVYGQNVKIKVSGNVKIVPSKWER